MLCQPLEVVVVSRRSLCFVLHAAAPKSHEMKLLRKDNAYLTDAEVTEKGQY
jgi:hypothetical protein